MYVFLKNINFIKLLWVKFHYETKLCCLAELSKFQNFINKHKSFAR